MSKTEANIAVIGCGHWGKNLVRNYAQLGALKSIVDGNPDTAKKMAADHNVSAQTYDEVLADPAIKGVVIATPAETHATLAKKAIEAGKHVYVEKPLTINVKDAEEVCQMAKDKGVVLMVGHLLQYHPAFIHLKNMVQSGDLGRLQYIYSHRMNLGKVRREENILWSFAPHDISMILALAGEEPNDVSAIGSCFLHETICDVTTTHMTFDNGVRAHIFVSWLHPFKEQKLVVIGEKGMAVFNDTLPWSEKLMLYPHKINWENGIPVPEKADGTPIPLDEAEPLKLECQHFLNAIETGNVPNTDGEEGLRVLKVLNQAQKSLEKKTDALTANAADYFIHESAYVDAPVEIGSDTKIWHFSHVLKNSKIGANCVIGQNVMIGPDAVIGNNCKIQNNVSLYKGVKLEDGVFCGPSCVFTNVNNPRAEIERKDEFRETLVKKGATIGANATIVCGHTIGRYAFIGAGATVTSNVPDYALYAGCPAKQIGWMSEAGAKLDDTLVCPIDGIKYEQTPEGTLQKTNQKEKAA